MTDRFACTACGKCCFGWIPLSIGDAIKHAGCFPIAMVWTPVKPVDPSFKLTARLFTSFRPEQGGRIALRIAPTAYIPPHMPCPQLDENGLCAIHPIKPLRCRTMPFFPLREERDQKGMLTPRAGWKCDVGDGAPEVYANGKILDRADFDAELKVIQAEAATIRRYADPIMASSRQMIAILSRTAEVAGGNVVLGFASLLQGLDVDIPAIARQQAEILRRFADATADDRRAATYHQRYTEWAAEMSKLGG